MVRFLRGDKVCDGQICVIQKMSQASKVSGLSVFFHKF